MESHTERQNPFPGLRAFEPEEDHLFFGRDTQVDELLTRLRRTRFLAIVGTSGSGKSSLVKSGLVPSLYSGYMAQAGSSWRVAIFRPGEDPIGNLASALNDRSVLGGGFDEPELADMNRSLIETTLYRSSTGLADAVTQARLPKDDRVLVLADQFEELFRFKGSRRIKDSREAAFAFVKLLLEASRQEEAPVYVVLTMRSDFIGNCTEFPGLVEAINDGQYLVPRMSRDERRQAIEGPVRVGGAEIAPRLVNRLLNDVGDDPDQLPILQHALMRAWDYWWQNRQDGEPVDLRHYEATGTMAEALSLHAEEAYRELGDEHLQRVCERLFRGLTDRGSDARGIRRPMPFAEACELAGASPEELARVVECFRRPGRSFLMPPVPVGLGPDTILDISHESLMRTWKRLIGWVDEEARAAQVYLRLSRAAERYHEGKAALYRDPELQLALNWRDETQPTGLWAERYDPAFERAMLFLEHSEKERQREIAEKERSRRRQLVLFRRLAVVGVLVALVMAFIGLYAFNQKAVADDARNTAETEKKRAERSAEAAVEAKAQAEENAEAARQAEKQARENAEAAQEAEKQARENAEAARQAEKQATENAEAARQAEKQAVENAQKAKAAEKLADDKAKEAGVERQRAEKEAAEAQRLRRLEQARALAVQTTRMRGDEELGARLALEAYDLHRRNQKDGGGEVWDGNVYSALWSALGNLKPKWAPVLRHHGDAVRALAAGGGFLATGGDDRAVRLVDLDAPRQPPRHAVETATEVRALAFDGDGRRLAVGDLGGADLGGGTTSPGEIRLWQVPDGTPQHLGTQPGGVFALAFSPDGRHLVSGGGGGRVALWDTAASGGTEPLESWDAGGKVTALAFSPGGEVLAVLAGGRARLWRLRGTEASTLFPLAADQDLTAVVWLDERTLATGSGRGEVASWAFEGGFAAAPPPPRWNSSHASAVTALAAADGLAASVGRDGRVRLWHPESPAGESARSPGDKHTDEPVVLTDHSGWVWAVAFAPDGEWVFAGGADKTVRGWPTRIEPLVRELCRLEPRELDDEEWEQHLSLQVERGDPCAPATPTRGGEE